MTVLDKSVPGELLMIVGCVMIALGWFVMHQWGWIMGGVMMFMLGVLGLKPLEGEKEEGLQEEGEES